LNRLFFTACQQGELDFLKGKIVLIEVSDFEFQFSLSLVEQKLLVNSLVAAPDLRVKASSEDFFLLCSAKADPDTLFFQRRLSMLGDTELGLYLKNFLDSFDTTTHVPASVLSVQQHIATELLKLRE
jgi:predicted lipid carrier protein YhbT